MAAETVLVVDDHPSNLKLIHFILASQGYELRTASSAIEALAILRGFEPKLILLDLQLPGMDGYELTKQLKGHDSTRHIPIVAVTAYAMKGDEERAREAGCDGYLTKPIDKSILRAMVAAYTGGPPALE